MSKLVVQNLIQVFSHCPLLLQKINFFNKMWITKASKKRHFFRKFDIFIFDCTLMLLLINIWLSKSNWHIQLVSKINSYQYNNEFNSKGSSGNEQNGKVVRGVNLRWLGCESTLFYGKTSVNWKTGSKAGQNQFHS